MSFLFDKWRDDENGYLNDAWENEYPNPAPRTHHFTAPARDNVGDYMFEDEDTYVDSMDYSSDEDKHFEIPKTFQQKKEARRIRRMEMKGKRERLKESARARLIDFWETTMYGTKENALLFLLSAA